jgi:hypothetical protein
MAIQAIRVIEPIFGQTTLASANNGTAAWVRGETSPLDQKGSTGWLANLNGGVQTGDDWARVSIPVYELPVTEFLAAQWSYYMSQTQTMGVNIVIWVHDPKDFDKRAEITQLANVSGLEKAAGWNAHELDTSVTQFFFYGENTTGTALTAGTQYTWAQFQADVLFKTWTIYRITFEYGWEASGTFADAYVAEIKLNGASVPLRPGLEVSLSNANFDIGDVTLLAGTAVIGKIRLVTATGDEITDDSADAVKAAITSIAAGTNIIGQVKDSFSGNIYSKTMTMTDDNATRFETSAKKLRDVIIIVTTNNMLLGKSGTEVYPVDADDTIGFTKVDVSTLYFKNASAGSNGTITILGVEE